MQKSIKVIVQSGLLTFFLIVAVACSQSSQTPTASGTMMPTQNLPTAATVLPTDQQNPPGGVFESTKNPINSALTPIVIEQPTLQLTSTPVPTPAGYSYPPALLQVEKPGDMSRLISPFLVMANVYPGDQGMVNVQLFGEDGRLMSDQLIQLTQVGSGWVSMASEIKFESLSAGESALLALSTRDAYGRRIAQVSVPVILLQIGKSELENAQFNKQPVILKSPVSGGFTKNGIVHLEGLVHLFNQNPIIVELFTQTGGIVANKALYLTKNGKMEFTPFTLDVPYSVTKRTPVRLTIRQASEISSNIDVFLYSQLIFLDP